jgi:Skp family chaperone for outer membrane proteins
MKIRILVSSIFLGLVATASFAQTAQSTVQRDVNQQTRIEEGLKSGSLSTREAARLEREQSEVSRLQARSLKDGKLTPTERARLDAAQDRNSRDINAAKHNGVTGNPQSASSQRMQADVQRNINQEKRIGQGLKSGELTKHEAARLERGQARTTHKEYVAGRDGHVGKREHARIQRTENRQSKKIYHQKHDAQTRPAV